MVITDIAELGSSVICSPDNDEEIIPAEGDGALLPGSLVYIATATGRITGSDLGNAELFVGIVLEHPTLGTDTAITADLPCSVVVPRSGHMYRVRILDLDAATQIGSGLDISGTPGYMDGATDINNALATVSKIGVDGDTVVEVRWL